MGVVETGPPDEILQATAARTVVQDLVDDELVLAELGVVVERRCGRRGWACVRPRVVLKGRRAGVVSFQSSEVNEGLEVGAAGCWCEANRCRARAEGDDGVRAAEWAL